MRNYKTGEPVRDALGVEIRAMDEVRILHYGYTVRAYDVGRTADVLGLTTLHSNLMLSAHTDHVGDPIARGKAVRPELVAVVRRDGEPGLEGNRPAEAPARPDARQSYEGGKVTRLYTRDHVSFDDVPADRAPSLVVVTRWGVSHSSTYGKPGVELNVYDVRSGSEIEYHELNGTRYPSDRDSHRAAFEAGLLAFMVYDEPYYADSMSAADFDELQARHAARA